MVSICGPAEYILTTSRELERLAPSFVVRPDDLENLVRLRALARAPAPSLMPQWSRATPRPQVSAYRRYTPWSMRVSKGRRDANCPVACPPLEVAP